MLRFEKDTETRKSRRTVEPNGIYRQALTENLATVATELIELLGPTLTAALTGVKDRKQPHRWAAQSSMPRHETENRLRLAYRIVLFLRAAENDHVIRAWFIGGNPNLNEDTPITAIREGRDLEAIAAAQLFVNEG